MCGIFGEFVINGKVTDESLFRKLNNLAALRGPDHEGFWTDRQHCQLGFRRLSILDLSPAGHQPMHSPNGRWVIVFNGEVYNFQEIKERLPRDKYQFRGHSDTEIILYAFDHFGVKETASILDGMFGIALYDRFEKELHLIRDFAGIKPLYYGFNGQRVIFGSQYDQVTRHPAFSGGSIDQSVLKLYLQQHYVPAPFGIIESTGQVEAGQIITFRLNGSISKHTFWTFPAPGIQRKDEASALEAIDQKLSAAVQAEMIADVPLGTFLSGGIDSPLVTYFASVRNSEPVKAFTIGSDSPLHDESDDAEAYGKLIGVDLHLRRMNSADALLVLDEVMESLKEPFADFSIIPTYVVSKLAREKVTVILSGDGGDELFFGYERFWSLLKNLPYFKIPHRLRYPAYAADKIFFGNRHVNSNLLQSSLGAAHFQLHSRFPEDEVNMVVPELSGITTKSYSNYSYSDNPDITRMLWEIQRAEFYGMMQKTLLKVDRASMANSLEVRVPFLKKSFIEEALTIDPFLSYAPGNKNGWKKEILKKLLRKKIPQAPVTNVKRGFSVPLSKWMKEDLKDRFRDTLLDKNFLQRYGMKQNSIEKLLNDHISGRRDRKWPIFTLYSLYVWDKKRIQPLEN